MKTVFSTKCKETKIVQFQATIISRKNDPRGQSAIESPPFVLVVNMQSKK